MSKIPTYTEWKNERIGKSVTIAASTTAAILISAWVEFGISYTVILFLLGIVVSITYVVAAAHSDGDDYKDYVRAIKHEP